MVFASAPSTPERGAQKPLVRRAFTAPIKAATPSSPLLEAETKGAESLYAHSAARIVSFTSSNNLGRRHSSVSDGRSEFGEAEAGSLPWASLTERTIAAGPLIIYRVLGSVAFLNSGAILHPILSKSQCWCVDGVSKFVLRIRASSYYRIELPHSSEGDKKQVEHFKQVLDEVLQYEKTPCPFKRGFTVDLPEPPSGPIVKKPWRPKQRELHSAERLILSAESLGEAKVDEEQSEDQTQQKINNDSDTSLKAHQATKVADFPLEVSDTSSITSVESGNDIEAGNCAKFMHGDLLQNENDTSSHFMTPTRPRRIVTGRTVTAPPQLSLRNDSPLTTSHSTTTSIMNKQDSSSVSSSRESFHSFHSPISPLPPSPPSPNSDSIDSATFGNNNRGHKRDDLEVTITSDARDTWDLKNLKLQPHASRPQTPAVVSDATSQDDLWDEVKTPSPPGLRVRQSLKKRRAQSPLPPSQNLYSPLSPKDNLSSHYFTSAIIQQGCSFVLRPPLHLVALMLRIAAKLVRGAFPVSISETRGKGEKIPCSWEFSSDGSDGSEELWEEEEDDYGVSLRKTLLGKDVTTKDIGGSWEID